MFLCSFPLIDWDNIVIFLQPQLLISIPTRLHVTCITNILLITISPPHFSIPYIIPSIPEAFPYLIFNQPFSFLPFNVNLLISFPPPFFTPCMSLIFSLILQQFSKYSIHHLVQSALAPVPRNYIKEATIAEKSPVHTLHPSTQ